MRHESNLSRYDRYERLAERLIDDHCPRGSGATNRREFVEDIRRLMETAREEGRDAERRTMEATNCEC